MKPDALMRLLVPDGTVGEVAGVLKLSASLIYQQRRPANGDHGSTGTRNYIACLDIISELALSHTPEAVRLLGQRYLDIYANTLLFPPLPATEEELRRVLALAQVEVAKAFAALTEHHSVDDCAVKVEQAVLWLQRCLKIVEALKEKEQEHVG